MKRSAHKKILISGAAGVIGRNLSHYLREAGHCIVPTDVIVQEGIITADLRDQNSIFHLIDTYQPEMIIHLASIKNLNFCENNKNESRTTNYGIVESVAKACAVSNIRMIFFSSDYVFGQYDALWQERDKPCPTTQYGIDKSDAESMIQNLLPDATIIRTAQVYGFAGDFVELVCQTLNAAQTFKAYTNLINCPTWCGDLFAMLHQIIQNDHRGIFHCVGPEALSRYEFALQVARAFNLDTACIHAEEIDFSNDIRPPVVRLDGTATYKLLGVSAGTLHENLPACASYITTGTLR